MDERNLPSGSLSESYTEKPFLRSNGYVDEKTIYDTVQSLWEIEINGEKINGYEALKDKTTDTHYLTVCMECAGNSRKYLDYFTEGLQWNNNAVFQVSWRGYSLAELMGPPPENALEIVCESYDGEFVRSFPVSVLSERQVIVADQMNDDFISHDHGGPLRLIVPGWYGMASVKWVKKIYYSDKPYEGKYQTDKYTYLSENGERKPVSVMKPKSLVTDILLGSSPWRLKGKAWSGHPLAKIEVPETDGHSLKVGSRATDITGETQPVKSDYNFYGYGNNAIQSFELLVK